MAQMVQYLTVMQDLGFDPWVTKSPGEGNGNSLQHSCLENSMDRGAWRSRLFCPRAEDPWGHKESDTTEQLRLTHSLNTLKKNYKAKMW